MLRIHPSLALFGAFAYAINTAAYIYRSLTNRASTMFILFGTCLVVAGYALMTLATASEGFERKTRKDKDVDEGDREHEHEHEHAFTAEAIGSGLLALFFTTSLFLGTNITLQLYDPLGALGYSALFASTWFNSLKAVGPVFLVLYYMWGGLHKVGEAGLTNRAQLVGRTSLAFYYLSRLALG